MPAENPAAPQHGNAYNIFILVLTILSLAIMVVQLLPINVATYSLLNVYDNVVCGIFLIDFFLNLTKSPSKRDYFIGRRGWLDLLGSIPSLGFFKYSGLLRLARLSRLARISRLLRGQNKKQLVDDVLQNRGEYAAFITVLAAFLVLTVTSALVLQFEAASPDANIKTGGDALWWALVTITTVGYGDRYPVTLAGRVTAFFVMIAGVGIIGALASILASMLVPPPPTSDDDEQAPLDPRAVQQELAQVRAELALIRGLLAAERRASDGQMQVGNADLPGEDT
jgi:voltage-gated potassium channel